MRKKKKKTYHIPDILSPCPLYTVTVIEMVVVAIKVVEVNIEAK